MKNILLILLTGCCFGVEGQSIRARNIPEGLRYPLLVKEFYYRKQVSLFWFAPGGEGPELREQLWHRVDSARYSGLDSSRYHYSSIRNNWSGAGAVDSSSVQQLEQLFTDAALALCKDLYQGKDIYDRLRYDELSARSAGAGDQQLLDQLVPVVSGAGLNELINRLEPHTKEYRALKQVLAAQLDSNAYSLKIKMLASSLDYYRWIDHFAFKQYILVNIASATLKYYDNDSLQLTMKIVAGKPSTPTPRFSARCTQVILYPYWNVPQRITLTELLPLFKRSPALVDAMGMQLIGPNGNIIDHHGLPWEKFSKSWFPYRVRQVTGCGNALGVIKFDLTDPFNVYMHDTNLKSAFASNSRYYSHGCIRLEKPNLLGQHLLGQQLDTTLLTQCLKDQKPIPILLDKPVPVLVVYITAEAEEDGQTAWYKDPYRLLIKK